MKAELTIENPGKISATIAFTFTLEQWATVQKALKEAPLYSAAGEIKDAVDALTTKVCTTVRYYPTADDASGEG